MKALQAGSSDLKTQLDALVRTRYFTPFLMEKSQKLTADNAVALAKATEFWVECLADFLSKIPSLLASPETRLGIVFHQPEKTLRLPYAYPDGRTLRVSGRYDCLLFDPDAARAVVFEFKGFKAADPIVELSQTLIYTWLIEKATGIVPAVKLIYLENDNPFDVSPTAVKKMMNNLPHLFDVTRQVLEKRLPLPIASDSSLCKNCPYDAKCDQDWGARHASQAPSAELQSQNRDESPYEERNAGQDEGRERMAQLLDTLRQRRLAVEGLGFVCGPSFIRLKIGLDMSKGTTVRKIEATAKDLQVALALSSPPMIEAQSGYVSVDVPRNVRQPLSLADMMKTAAPTRPKSEAAFPLGLDIDGKVFWVDLAEPIMTSILIGGTSGSGKSVLLRSAVISLLLCSPPDSLSFTLIDPKRVTFTDLNTLRCLEEGKLLLDTEDAMTALSATVEEMERRYVLMENAEVSDVGGYNEKSAALGTVRLKRRVVIIDEYADMIVSSQTRAALELFVQRICQKGRAAGIHLILATQRPDAKVVTGIIKANLQLRVALKVTSQANSQIILGEGVGQAQYLLGHGDLLVGGSVPLQRLQAPLASANMLKPELLDC
jgi:S-DNA-T family DNA segregation ATPase FtsK/SpoIIIE